MALDSHGDPADEAVYRAFDISTTETIIYDTRHTEAWVQSDRQCRLDEMR
ncbi:hypothetical protein [Haloarchaeobius sp. DT45]